MRLAVTFQKRNFFFRKFFMADISDHRPTITKKGNFDGWYKYLKNYFGIKFPFLVILMAYISDSGTHNYQKRKFLMGGITDPKTILKWGALNPKPPPGQILPRTCGELAESQLAEGNPLSRPKQSSEGGSDRSDDPTQLKPKGRGRKKA